MCYVHLSHMHYSLKYDNSSNLISFKKKEKENFLKEFNTLQAEQLRRENTIYRFLK